MKPTKQPKIIKGEIKLIVPYEGGGLASIYPILGTNNYQVLGNAILKRGQLVPTGDYTAFLVHSAYCDKKIKKEPESSELRCIIRDKYLYVFNRDLWTSKGLFVLLDEKAIGLSQPLDENELENMLRGGKDMNGIRFSKYGELRFAPKGSYRFGEHTPESLSKDGYVVASYNIKGAEKLGEVSSEFKSLPKTFGLEIKEGQKAEQRVSALNSSRNGHRFGLNGDNLDDNREWLCFWNSSAPKTFCFSN